MGLVSGNVRTSGWSLVFQVQRRQGHLLGMKARAHERLERGQGLKEVIPGGRGSSPDKQSQTTPGLTRYWEDTLTSPSTGTGMSQVLRM